MNRRRSRDRNASVTLEFILVLPFLVVTLFALAQFSVALLIRQAIAQAATVGAREAGKGEDLNEVARAVDGVLQGAHGIKVVNLILPDPLPAPPVSMTSYVPVADSGVRVHLEVGQLDAAGRPASSVFSDPNFPPQCDCEPPVSPLIQPDEVRVTVFFDTRRHPIGNWLHSFSDDYVDFGNRFLSASALVKKE